MFSFMLGFFFAVFLIGWIGFGMCTGMAYLGKAAPQQLAALMEHIGKKLED